MDQTRVINLQGFYPLYINHLKDNILQKHNIISFIIIWEKWHNTARDIVIDAESLSSDELGVDTH